MTPKQLTIEELDKVLAHKNIMVRPRANKEEIFVRNRDFTINGVDYTIEWWANTCYLHCGDITVPFKSVVQSGTWPNRKKLNLQFYDLANNICCIVALEDWDVKEVSNG